jgi:hypothetical protein
MTKDTPQSRLRSWGRRPLGRGATLALAMAICLAPAWLFFDRLESYFVYGDDWEYVASSRTFARAIENLFRPHNVHVVPVWRLVSWLVVAIAGRLERVQEVMAGASYAALAAVMLLAGRLVARETGRVGLALATMVGLGTTALMSTAATWFSASQALGAGFGILAMLWYLQSWRRSGGAWRLALAAAAASLAGGAWTVGHAAGPVGAVYLWADGRRRCRRAAPIPLIATALTAVAILWVGGRGIQRESTISFHGRKTAEAIAPLSGAAHTLQAIPERLILGDLALVAEATFWQAVVLVVGLAVIWAWTRRGGGRPSPLECTGAAIVLSSYFLEMTFRGYLPFSSLRGFIPWYETIPQIGAALFAAGWWAALRSPVPRGETVPLSRAGAAGLVAFQAALIVLHQPRVDAMFIKGVSRMSDFEREKMFLIPKLQRLRAVYLADERAARQRRHLARLDQAQEVARHRGIGREALRRVFGRVLWPEPPVIDDADLLDLPRHGPETSPATIRRAVGPAFVLEPEPRPPWLPPEEPWPPK